MKTAELLSVALACTTLACAATPALTPTPTPTPTPTLTPTPAPTPTLTLTPAPAPTPAADEMDFPVAPRKGTYALVVSFGSECCGTDRDASSALGRIIARYPRKALGHARGHWGKEGESDDCFTLEGLAPADRARFVGEVKSGVTGKLVTVAENAPCQNDR